MAYALLFCFATSSSRSFTAHDTIGPMTESILRRLQALIRTRCENESGLTWEQKSKHKNRRSLCCPRNLLLCKSMSAEPVPFPSNLRGQKVSALRPQASGLKVSQQQVTALTYQQIALSHSHFLDCAPTPARTSTARCHACYKFSRHYNMDNLPNPPNRPLVILSIGLT